MMAISDLFISNAYAEGAAAQPAPGMMDFVPLIGLVLVFYFIILRPQMKRAKEVKTMLSALQKGDEVVTSGGVMGRVSKVADTYVVVEAAANVELNIQKSAIQNVLPKGTLKSMN